MINHSDFYYLNQLESSQYSQNPPGNLSIERLIKNKAPWKKFRLAKAIKPKALILTDWTATLWSQEKLKNIQCILKQLLENGFSLYVWQNGEIITLNEKNLDRFNDHSFLQKITPIDHSVIFEQALKQHRLIRKKIHFLDDYWIDSLLNIDEKNPERSLSIKNFCHNFHNKSAIIALLKQSSPPLTQIILDEYSTEAHEKTLKLKKEFPKANILTHYVSIQCDEHFKLETQFDLPQLEPSDLFRIESFVYRNSQRLLLNNVQIKDLYDMLRSLPSLKYLQLNSMILMGSPDQPCPMPQLEKFELETYDDDTVPFTSLLMSLLKNMPNLKIFNYSHYGQEQYDIQNTTQFSLPYLEEFKSYSKSVYHNLLPALSSSQNLKKLDISYSRSADNLILSKIDLSHLEYLSLVLCSTDYLASILQKTTQLKSLYLLYNDISPAVLSSLNMGYLESLYFTNSIGCESNLVSILSAAPQLKTLRVSNLKSFPIYEEMRAALSNLERLDLIDSELTKNELHDLLAATPMLTKLTLNHNHNLHGFDAHDLSLSRLEEIDIDESNIEPIALSRIISKAPKLRALGIHRYDIDDLFENIPNLDQLETLDLNSLKLSAEKFEQILLKAKNIKFLYLEESDLSQTSYIFTKPILLKNLEMIDVDDTSIVDENLKILKQSLLDDESDDTPLNHDALNLTSKPIGVRTEFILDANPSLTSETTFEVNQYFKSLSSDIPDPIVSHYRMYVFDHLHINPNPCSLNDAFILKHKNDADLSPYQPILTNTIDFLSNELSSYSEPGDYILGQQIFLLNGEWQAIASLSPHERLTHVQFNSKIDASNIEFSYSEQDNLYYIRTLGNTDTVHLKFLLHNPKKVSPIAPIPNNIQPLMDDLLSYSSGDLILDQTTPTGEDYFKSLMRQKIGSCRHRVLIFKQRMEELYPEIPVRLIFNECHAFAEIQWEGLWHLVELGGYPGQINLHEPAPQEEVESFYQNVSSINPYIEPLETWNKNTALYPSFSTYCEAILKDTEHKKRLIELNSSNDVTMLQFNLQNHCQSLSKPYFYIDSPDDLVCSAPWIKRKLGSDHGVSTPGPGGPLYEFLMQPYTVDNPPVLIVNYDHFDADDIVRFNSLLDQKRYADGTVIPPDTCIIGIIDRNKPHCYQGEDFYSRFDKKEECPLSSAELSHELPPLPILQKTSEDQPTTVINLFNGQDWKERLLGYWTIQGDTLIYQDGELETALKKNLPIELQNAPWDDEAFLSFWRQAFLQQKIEHEHHTLIIPPSLQLLQNDGYAWQNLITHLTYDRGLIPHALVLNLGTFGEFFIRYRCDNDQKKLYSEPGYLEMLKGQTLDINVTQNLDEDEWAKILDTCQKHQVVLKLHLAKGVTLPPSMTHEVDEPIMDSPLSSWDGEIHGSTTVIQSNDLGYTLHELTSADPDCLVIDVSECEPDDLLTKIYHEYHETTGQLLFKKVNRALFHAWSEKKNIILKGEFSPSLVNALSPILLDRLHDEKAPGRLILLSQDEPFQFLNTLEQKVTTDQKRQALLKQFSLAEINLLPEYVFQESFQHLQTRLNYLRTHPHASSSDLAWDGFESLSRPIHFDDFNPQDSAKISHEFNQQRRDAIDQELLHAPYVFITGLTAVGKTSFVEKCFNTEKDRLYQGIAAIQQWAKDQSPHQRKILFMDEANLNTSQWSAFEGLFNHPPEILIDGSYYPLSDQHKVIFAGNPMNYSDDRTLAPFFKEHGHALVFDPLPLAFIFEEILKPVFENSYLMDYSIEICRPILDIYRFFCEHTSDQILLSPRELQLIALFVHSYTYHQLASPQAAIAAAYHYAYQITMHLVPERYRAEFDLKFNKNLTLPYLNPIQYADAHQEFLITPSRQPILKQLDDFLTLRDFKRISIDNEYYFPLTGIQNIFPAHNTIQSYGGLSGVVLEGEPGIGKSDLVISALHARGYQACLDHRDFPDKILPENPYYVMPASMQIEDKKRLLLTAFHEGAVVICDEINSSPMMESFLNSLLMGKTPDNFPIGILGGQPPKKTGFLIIGTQNPPSHEGRNLPSHALARRLLTLQVPAYERDEMIAILINKGVPDEQSHLLADAYLKNKFRAKKRHLNPQPTFRDLLQVASPWMQQVRTEEPSLMSVEEAPSSMKRFSSETSICSVNKHSRILDQPTLEDQSTMELISCHDQRFFSNKREAEEIPLEKIKWSKSNN